MRLPEIHILECPVPDPAHHQEREYEHDGDGGNGPDLPGDSFRKMIDVSGDKSGSSRSGHPCKVTFIRISGGLYVESRQSADRTNQEQETGDPATPIDDPVFILKK